MKNYFEIWNKIKKILDKKNPKAFPKKREIWLVNIGKNIGFEIDGKTDQFWRPILVLKKLSKDTFWTIPLTSVDKKGSYCMRINEKSLILFDQVKVLDRRRFIKKLNELEKINFESIMLQCKKYLFGEAFSVEPR